MSLRVDNGAVGFCDVEVTVLLGELEYRVAVSVTDRDVCPVLCQCYHAPALSDGTAQRQGDVVCGGVQCKIVQRVNHRAVAQKQLHDIFVAVIRGHHEGRLAARRAKVNLALFNQALHSCDVAL
eukprot:TRINITY_DN8964_c0_g1_i2.p1 TRINITY_DN8964_c0_g1~~TRINITY_DN8964_c0_g1_i2.p1  ORF type:complete len:124 (+),score=11.21 TRINITY_DN8964_c0_g1_i2:158-529(+)